MQELLNKLEGGWRKLVALLDSRSQGERQLLEALQRDYREEQAIAELLEKESKRIPYVHLRKKLMEIAESEKRHASQLREKIEALGGEVPEHAQTVREKRAQYDFSTTLDFLRLLEEEKNEYVEYLETAHLAEDLGHKALRDLLMTIGEEERKHRQELIDIITRLNPLPVR